jgi:hypothetical protein
MPIPVYSSIPPRDSKRQKYSRKDPFPVKLDPAPSSSTIKIIDYGLADKDQMHKMRGRGSLIYQSPGIL